MFKETLQVQEKRYIDAMSEKETLVGNIPLFDAHVSFQLLSTTVFR